MKILYLLFNGYPFPFIYIKPGMTNEIKIEKKLPNKLAKSETEVKKIAIKVEKIKNKNVIFLLSLFYSNSELISSSPKTLNLKEL